MVFLAPKHCSPCHNCPHKTPPCRKCVPHTRPTVGSVPHTITTHWGTRRGKRLVHWYTGFPWATSPVMNGPKPTRRTKPLHGVKTTSTTIVKLGVEPHNGQTVPAPSTPTDKSHQTTTTHLRSNIKRQACNFSYTACTTTPHRCLVTRTVTRTTSNQRVETGKLLLGSPKTAPDFTEEFTYVLSVLGEVVQVVNDRNTLQQHMAHNAPNYIFNTCIWLGDIIQTTFSILVTAQIWRCLALAKVSTCSRPHRTATRCQRQHRWLKL